MKRERERERNIENLLNLFNFRERGTEKERGKRIRTERESEIERKIYQKILKSIFFKLTKKKQIVAREE